MLRGDRFPTLAGRPESDLRASVWRDGHRVPVPLQVDECDEAGSVVVSKDAMRPRLGPSSVLLLRRADASGAAPAKLAHGAYAIHVAPGSDGGWIYLSAATPGLEASSEDDVDYDAARDRIHARRYGLAFRHPRVDSFALATAKGSEGPNLIDRLKARVTARLLWGLVRFRRNEDQVTEVVVGYRDGALRVTRRAELAVEVGWGLPSPRFVAEDTFYADHAEAPVTISLPFSLGYVFGDLDVRIYLDFRDLDGWEVLAEGLGARALRVGAGQNMGFVPGASSWFALRSGDHALLHRLRLGGGLESVHSALEYWDDRSRADPPESVVGAHPAIGYRLTRWSKVARGRHDLWMETYVLDGAAAANPRAFLSAFDSPLAVSVGAP